MNKSINHVFGRGGGRGVRRCTRGGQLFEQPHILRHREIYIYVVASKGRVEVRITVSSHLCPNEQWHPCPSSLAIPRPTAAVSMPRSPPENHGSPLSTQRGPYQQRPWLLLAPPAVFAVARSRPSLCGKSIQLG